jgi:hypothetical protein
MMMMEEKAGWTQPAIRIMVHVKIPAPETTVTTKITPKKRCIQGVWAHWRSLFSRKDMVLPINFTGWG